MRKTRFFALFLSLVLALSTVPALAAESDWLIQQRKSYDKPFPDVTGTWCASYVETVYEAGLMEGKTADRFDAVSTLTNAQIMAVSARLLDLLKGGDGQIPLIADAAWYLTYYNDMAPILGYETGSALTDVYPPNDPCTRIAFVNLLSAVLKGADTKLPVLNSVTSIPDLGPVEADEAYDNVLAFYNAGILNGADDYGSFRAFATLKRGEAAAMLARLVDPALRRTFTLKSFDLCADVLGVAPDTVLLTVGGRAVTAELFACQLCTSLHQRGGGARAALEDAVSAWCCYAAPFRPLAEQLGLSLTEEEAQAEQYGRETAGYLGLSAAYWQYQQTGVLLNAKMRTLYWEKDWKNGEAAYHNDLEAMSEALLESAELSPALEALDLTAVYGRLAASPFPLWNF